MSGSGRVLVVALIALALMAAGLVWVFYDGRRRR